MALILIVEGEGILAYKLQMDLENMGHEVVGIVDNGKEAIEIARGEKPDIIMMDIVLKGSLNGIEATGIICEGNRCKIIYLTDNTVDITVEAAKSPKHVGFLYKLFEPSQLKKVLEKALG